jgi:hypothetical protein
MKKFAYLLSLSALVFCAPIRADDCCENTEATVQQRLRDIDLTIALKKYEQLQSECAKAELQLVMLEVDPDLAESERSDRKGQLLRRADILKKYASDARQTVLRLSKELSVAAK